MTPRVLVLTLRNVLRLAAYAGWYEFEDVVATIADATFVPVSSYHGDTLHRIHRSLYHGLRSIGFASGPALRASKWPTPHDAPLSFDLLVLLAATPFDLFNLAQVATLLPRVNQKIAWIIEAWPDRGGSRALPLEPHEAFDMIYLTSGDAQALSTRWGGRPVETLPPGADVLRFEPARPGQRALMALNPGRRSPSQHKALLQASALSGRPYLFDTVGGGHMTAPTAHRDQYLRLCRWSDILIANPARFDETEVIGNAVGVSARPAEAAVSGTLLVGHQPIEPRGRAWTDGLVACDVGFAPEPELLISLASDRELLERANVTNQLVAAESLDWSYHWLRILRDAGVEPGPLAAQRVERLGERAELIRRW